MSLVSKAQKAVEILTELSEETSFSEYLLGQLSRTISSLETDVISEQVYVLNRSKLEEKEKFTVTDAAVISIKSDGNNFGGRHVSWQRVLVLDPKYGKVMFNTSQNWVYSADRGDLITGTLRVKKVKENLVIAQCKHRDMVLSQDSGRGVFFETDASLEVRK